jgi:hypothetical protein
MTLPARCWARASPTRPPASTPPRWPSALEAHWPSAASARRSARPVARSRPPTLSGPRVLILTRTDAPVAGPRLSAPAAIVARIPPGSSSPATSGFASDCTRGPGTDRTGHACAVASDRRDPRRASDRSPNLSLSHNHIRNLNLNPNPNLSFTRNLAELLESVDASPKERTFKMLHRGFSISPTLEHTARPDCGCQRRLVRAIMTFVGPGVRRHDRRGCQDVGPVPRSPR